MAPTQENRRVLRDGSNILQGGSVAKDWDVKELKACGATGTTISRELDLSGDIHPVFFNWAKDVEPRHLKELEQPLLLASKLLNGTGLQWVSDFIIDDIFAEEYPGRHGLKEDPTNPGSLVDTVTRTNPKPRLSEITHALRVDETPEMAPPLSPSSTSITSSSPSSGSYLSPRSSVASSVYSATECPSESPTTGGHINKPAKYYPLPSSLPKPKGRSFPLVHRKSASTSIVDDFAHLPKIHPPETIIRHRRASWWSRGLEARWLQRTDRWLRRELGPALKWHLDGSSAISCSNSVSHIARLQGGKDSYNVYISAELPERLATLRRSGGVGGEEYLWTAFMTCMALLHELGHAVYWKGCHPKPFSMPRSSCEPFYGADLTMELGDSFVASVFGGWVPVPIVLPEEKNGREDAGGSSPFRFDAGLAWRQALSWDRHRIRPKYRAHYSIPIDHMALMYSQASWDCSVSEPASLIHPLALVQDKTALLTNTVGLITNAAVLKGEHACAAVADFEPHPVGEGWIWKQARSPEQYEFRIRRFNGRLASLEAEPGVASDDEILEALPLKNSAHSSETRGLPPLCIIGGVARAATNPIMQSHQPEAESRTRTGGGCRSTAPVMARLTTGERRQAARTQSQEVDSETRGRSKTSGSELITRKMSETRSGGSANVSGREKSRGRSLTSRRIDGGPSRDDIQEVPPLPQPPALPKRCSSRPNYFLPAYPKAQQIPGEANSVKEQIVARSLLPTSVRITTTGEGSCLGASHARSVSDTTPTITTPRSALPTATKSGATAPRSKTPTSSTPGSTPVIASRGLRRSASAKQPLHEAGHDNNQSDPNTSFNNTPSRNLRQPSRGRSLADSPTIPISTLPRPPPVSILNTYTSKIARLSNLAIASPTVPEPVASTLTTTTIPRPKPRSKSTHSTPTTSRSSHRLEPLPASTMPMLLPLPSMPKTISRVPTSTTTTASASRSPERRHHSCSRATTYGYDHDYDKMKDDGEITVDELRARLADMIDTSLTELEWLYF